MHQISRKTYWFQRLQLIQRPAEYQHKKGNSSSKMSVSFSNALPFLRLRANRQIKFVNAFSSQYQFTQALLRPAIGQENVNILSLDIGCDKRHELCIQFKSLHISMIKLK